MKTFCYASCLVLILAGAAQASTVNVYDGIDYGIGSLNGDGPATGLGLWNTDSGVIVNATTLSNTLAKASTGGKVTGFFDFINPLSSTIAPTPGNGFWASFLLYHSGPNDQSFMGLGPAGAVLHSLPSVAIGVRLGKYGIFDGGTFTASGVAYTPNGTTDFLVAHIFESGGSWNVDLFVNKGSFTVPDLSSNVAGVTFGTMINHNQAQFESDEYRLGDNSSDVAAGVTAAQSATWGRIKGQYR